MHSFTNGLSQVASIVIFNLRTIPQRKGAAASAALGIAGVVAVLVGVLAIAEGFRKTMDVSGTPDLAIVIRSGADSEMTSVFSREETRVIADAPGLARNAQGAIASAELFVIIDLPKRSTGTPANVPLRGVGPQAFDARGNVRIVKGRSFEPGKDEVIVGVGAAREFAGLDVGQAIRIGQNAWNVVGIFSAGGGVAESEVWSDVAVLQPAYRREDAFQSVYAKLSSAGAFTEFKDWLTSNPQIKVKVSRVSEYFEEQSTMLTEFIRNVGVFIAVLMAFGALFGALNTMYSAVAARTREIATLRALGFGVGPVMVSVMAESVVLALAGGVLGAGAAYLAFDGFTAATINWQTFSQVAFAFAVTPRLLVQAIVWALTIGLVGGAFPAIRAARMPIAAGLRE
jgi:putative ABC transport system permease protein